MEEIISIRLTGDTSELDSASSRSVVSLDNLQQSLSKTELRVNSLASSLRAYGANSGVIAQNSRAIADALKAASDGASKVSFKPIQITAEVGAIQLPNTALPPVKLAVEASVPDLTAQLQDAAKPVQITVDTSQAYDRVAHLQESISLLKAEIAEKRATVPLLTDSGSIAAAQKEILGLESELTRLQGRLEAVKPLAVNVSVQANTDEAARKLSLLQSAATNIRNEIAAHQLTINTDADTSKVVQAKQAVVILEDELSKLQAQIDVLRPTINVSATVEKIAVPSVTPVAIKVPVEVESVVLPKVAIPPINIPVRVDDDALRGLPAVSSAAGKKAGEGLSHGMTAAAYQARFAVLDLSHLVRDLPYAIANPAVLTGPFDRMFQAITTLNQETGGFKGTLATLKGALSGGTGVLIAVELATTALTLFSQGVFSSSEATDEAKKKQEEFATSLRQVEAGALATGAKLQAFVAVARDASLSDSVRNEALKEVNKTLGEHAQKLTLTTIGTAAATEEVTKFTQALIAQAVAAKYSDRVADLFIKQTDAAKAYGEALAKYNAINNEKPVSKATDINDAAFDAGRLQGAFGNLANAATAYKSVTKELQETTGNLNTETKKSITLFGSLSQTKFATGSLDELGDKLKKLKEQFNGLSAADRTSSIGSGLSGQIKSIESQIKLAQNEISISLKKGPAEQFNFFDQFFDVAPNPKKIEKQITEMAKAARSFADKNINLFEGLNPILQAPDSASIVASGKKFWDAFQKGLIKLKPQRMDAGALELVPTIKEPQQFDFASAFFGSEGSPLDKKFTLDIPLDKEHIIKDFQLQFRQLGRDLPKAIDVADPVTGVVKKVDVKTVVNTADLTKGLKAAKIATVEQIKALNDDINKALQGISVQGFATIGTAIGAVLSGSGIQEAFQSLGSFIGDAISKLGEEMIALSPVILAIQAAIKSFNPALLLPAGIALTALGAVIKGMFANSLPGHATGLDYVPYDNYVARLHKGEMVLTATDATAFRNAISSMSSGLSSHNVGGFSAGSFGSVQPQPIILAQRLRGRDMVLQQARENKSQRRGG